MNKTMVKIRKDDGIHGEYKKGEVGYVDGYVRSSVGPMACVVIKDRIILVPINTLDVIREEDDEGMEDEGRWVYLVLSDMGRIYGAFGNEEQAKRYVGKTPDLRVKRLEILE